MAIITAAEYKTHRGITGSDYDAILAVIIASKQSWLETQCGRLFDEDTYADLAHDGDGTPKLWLKHTPGASVTAVKLLNSDGTTTTMDSSSYRLVNGEYLLRESSAETAWEPHSPFGDYRGPCFPDGDGNVLVSYTGGYASGSMPSDLKDLMYTLVDMGLDERGQNPIVQQRADGVIQRTRMTAVEKRTVLADLVRPWKRVCV